MLPSRSSFWCRGGCDDSPSLQRAGSILFAIGAALLWRELLAGAGSPSESLSVRLAEDNLKVWRKVQNSLYCLFSSYFKVYLFV